MKRQPDGEAGAVSLGAFDRDTAAVKIDDHLDQIKPNSGSHDTGNVAAAGVTLEYLCEIRGRNADPLIIDRNEDVIRVGMHTEFELGSRPANT